MNGACMSKIMDKNVSWLIPWLLVLMFTNSACATTEFVGKVVFSKGAVSARGETNVPRLLGRDSPVYRNDTITTGKKSFTVIRFNDQTKMSLRPNSEVIIDKYNDKAGQEEAEFSLVKGGLRALTGLVGKRKPQNVRFKTRQASIGIRGTDLVLRYCEKNECELEELSLAGFEPVKTSCASKIEGQPPGFFFAVLDGSIYSEKNGSRVELDAISAGYASEKEVSCISLVPRFIVHDEYLNTINQDTLILELFQFIGDNNEFPSCEIL